MAVGNLNRHLPGLIAVIGILFYCQPTASQRLNQFWRYHCYSEVFNVTSPSCMYFGSADDYGCCFKVTSTFKVELSCALAGTFCPAGKGTFVNPFKNRSGTNRPSRTRTTRRPNIQGRSTTTSRPTTTRVTKKTTTPFIWVPTKRTIRRFRTTTTTTTRRPYRTYQGNSYNKYNQQSQDHPNSSSSLPLHFLFYIASVMLMLPML